MKRDFIMPILVLTLICLLMSGALAVGNRITRPVIEQAAAERAEAARKEIIPAAARFDPIHAEGLPRSVTEAYGTPEGLGYIFMVTASGGYGGDIRLIIGIDPEGRILRSQVLSHTETPGFGTVVFEKAADYEGWDRAGAETVDGVAGATISTNAYRNALWDAFTAFEIIKGARG